MMKIRNTEPKKNRKGMVLPFVIAIAVILAILGIGMIQLGFGSRLMAALTTSGITARAAADAGITDALYKMNAALNFDGNINPALWPSDVLYPPGTLLPDAVNPPPNANFSYEILGPFDPQPGTPYAYYEIKSTGRSGREIKGVVVRTRRQSYWFGVGVKEDFSITSGGIFGTYPSGSPFEGSVRTNSIGHFDVYLGPETELLGDLVVGPGGDTEYVIQEPSGTATVEGSTYAAAESLDFPDAELPSSDRILALGGWQSTMPTFVDIVDEATDLSIKRATITTGAYTFTDLQILQVAGTEWSEVEIMGEVVIHVARDVTIGNGCKLFVGDRAFVAPPSRLELYLGVSDATGTLASMVARNGSSITTLPRTLGDVPHSLDLKIYGLPSCTTTSKNDPAITLHNSGEFWGVIYAPDAPLSIHNSGNMYGGFIGYSLDIDNSGAFYYDSRIPGEVDEGPSFFEIDRWWEVP